MASEASLASAATTEAAAPRYPELQFLNVTGSTELDDTARTTIRTQSLRDYHRKRRIRLHPTQDPCKPPREAPRREEDAKSQVRRFRLGHQGLEPTRTQPQPMYIRGRGPQVMEMLLLVEAPVGSAVFDPFDMLPLPSTPKLRFLVKQLLTRVSSNAPTNDYRRAWFEHALNDLAFFFIALSQASADAHLTLRKGTSSDAIFYQNEGISLLNERLSNPLTRLADSTVAAVAALTSYEASNGSFEAAEIHLNGLEQMVRMRGGLQDRSFGPKLRRLVLWADSSAGSQLDGRPRFAMPFEPVPWDSVPGLFAQLRRLAGAKAAKRFVVAPEDGEMSYGDVLYVIQRRLMVVVSEGFENSRCTVETAWALAALIYMHTCLCETSFQSHVVEMLANKLEQCAEQTMELINHTIVAEDDEMMNLTSWTLTIGGIAAGSQDQRKYFVSLLRAFWNEFYLGEYTDRKDSVRGMLWDSTLDAAAFQFWREVEIMDSMD